jgi:hypothetical protein
MREAISSFCAAFKIAAADGANHEDAPLPV